MTQSTYEKGKLYDVPLSDLQVDPNQPRRFFDEGALGELTTSIATHGVLAPVLFRCTDTGEILLVAGERRYQASLQAGLSSIPAILVDGNPAEIAIVENLLREDLTAIEEAEAIAQLRDAHGYTLSDLSRSLGKSESILSDIISLTKLPDEVKNDCRTDPKTSRGVLVEIAKQATAKKMIAVYQKCKASGMTRGELRETVRQKKSTQPLDLDFLRRFTQRLDSLQVGSLDAEQVATVTTGLEELRTVLNKKMKSLKLRPQDGQAE